MTVIDDYIQTAAPAKQPRLRQIQAAIKAELPDATAGAVPVGGRTGTLTQTDIKTTVTDTGFGVRNGCF